MKKIILLTLVSLALESSLLAYLCEPSYFGWNFSSLSIDEAGHAQCNYSYCYYGCMAKSYKLDGCYKTGQGNWNNGSCREGCTLTTTTCND